MKRHIARPNIQQLLFDIHQNVPVSAPERNTSQQSHSNVISFSEVLARHQESIRQGRYERISRLAEHLG